MDLVCAQNWSYLSQPAAQQIHSFKSELVDVHSRIGEETEFGDPWIHVFHEHEHHGGQPNECQNPAEPGGPGQQVEEPSVHYASSKSWSGTVPAISSGAPSPSGTNSTSSAWVIMRSSTV